MCVIRAFAKCSEWADESELGDFECDDTYEIGSVASKIAQKVALEWNTDEGDLTVRFEVIRRV